MQRKTQILAATSAAFSLYPSGWFAKDNLSSANVQQAAPAVVGSHGPKAP